MIGRCGRAMLAVLALCASAAVHAGSVEGPYLVWMNLGRQQPEHADAQITAFANGEQRLCWEEGALLYMRSRPAGLTPALVRQALVQRDAAAQRRLRALLRQPFDEVPGFDGVVAYVDEGEPRLLSLGRRGPVRAEALRNAAGDAAWGATFCRLMPPISRRP